MIVVDTTEAQQELKRLREELVSHIGGRAAEYVDQGGRRIAEKYQKIAQQVVDRETGKFFQQIITGGSHRGVGRTSSLRNPMSKGYSSPELKRPWKSLSAITKSRPNGKNFFLHGGHLERELSALSWTEVFGAPVVNIERKTTYQEHLRKGFASEEKINKKGEPYTQFRNKLGQFQTLEQAMRFVATQSREFELVVDYSELEGISQSFDFEEAVSDHTSPEIITNKSGGSREVTVAHKLKGRAEWFRPLIGPYVGWMMRHNVPNLIKKKLK